MNELIYDYIVIGTGPAGAIIAKTLSDDRRVSVLLLEAGENNDADEPISNSAFASAVLPNQYYPQYFWQGEGIPQKDASNRTFHWTTGRLLGGGSSVNYELYIKPTPSIFRKWQSLLGPLWSPEQAILHFKEIEKYSGRTDNPGSRGYNGRLNIRQAPTQPTMMAKKLVFAIEQATGFREILDYNNPYTPIGPYTHNQYTQKPNGSRESASTAFLSEDIVDNNGYGVAGRKLRLLTKSTVLRILFCGKRAVGIEFLKEGKFYKGFIRKKVIVSAGIKSPKLLMISGIGPSDELKKAGIHVIFDNPNVGRHLSNHTITPAIFSTNPNDTPIPVDDPNARIVGGAFLPNPAPGSDSQIRKVQFVPFSSGNTLILGISALQPKSRGTVTIQSNDPLKIELGNEGYLSNPDDMELLKNTFRIYIQSVAGKLNNIDPQYQLISPTIDIINDDRKLENFIRQNVGLMYHEQGTVRMAESPINGVVNYRGEVFGVKDLIVADNSIIPFTVDSTTVAPAYLIGLAIAQQILNIRE